MVTKIPDSLVKFCDATTAEKILSSQALRWSAPHLFSDPFELRYDSQLNFSEQDLLKATVRHAVTMIFGAESPAGATPMVQAIRRWRSEERFDSPDEAESVLKGLLAQMVSTRQQQIDQLMETWRSYAQRLRVCCFCSKTDNLEAWQLFADNHRGVALRFKAGEETSLPNPKSIIYQEFRPEITRLRDQLDAIIKNKTAATNNDFASKFLVKPKQFANQKEWRCMRLQSEKNQANPLAEASDYNDIRFAGQELAGIYFGINTSTEVQNKLTKLAISINPKIRIFVGHRHAYQFELQFERLNPRANSSTANTSSQAVS